MHLLSLAVGVLLSLLTHKTELIVRGVYGAGKTQCIALLAAFFALRGHQVYYASRENDRCHGHFRTGVAASGP